MKARTKRGISRVLLVAFLLPMLLSLTACTEDAFTQGVNASFIQSPAAEAYKNIFNEQLDIMRQLMDMKVITEHQFAGFQVEWMKKLTVSLETISASDDKTNAGVETMLKAMVWQKHAGVPGGFPKLAGNANGDSPCAYPENDCQASTDKKYNKENFGHSADCLHTYHKHDIYSCIEKSKYSLPASKESDVVPLDVWGGADKLQEIIDGYNNLQNVDIYALNPARTASKLTDTNFGGLADVLHRAQSGEEAALKELIGSQGWFTQVANKFEPPHTENLKVTDIYIKSPTPMEANACSEHSIPMHYMTIDLNRIIKALGLQAGDDSPFSRGVLIGNKFFIVEYDVAVLAGFREVGSSSGAARTYAPIFTYPDALSATNNGVMQPTPRYEITGSDSPYTETLSTSDSVLSDTTALVMNIATGTLYRKGVDTPPTTSVAYMGLGTKEVQSAVRAINLPLKRVEGTGYVSFAMDGASLATKGDESLDEETSSVKASVGIVETHFYTYKDGHPKAGTQITYAQPVFVLAEYLELVYSPDVIVGENLIAYGRKIRLETTLMTASPVSVTLEKAARIVGEGVSDSKWGSSDHGLPYLSLVDFIDIGGFYSLDGSSKGGENGGSLSQNVAAVRLSSQHDSGHITSGDSSAARGDIIPQIVAQKGINCVARFGSTIIARADNQLDNASSTQTPLYGLAVLGGLYDRGLFGTWINSASNLSLDNWVKALRELGYDNYNINGAILTESLRGNYAYELNKDGILGLDLNTTIEISKQNVDDRRGYGVMILRTVLLVLGFVLIAYISALFGAWAVDVNLDFGINLLTKLSFGHYVAVRSLDEMPPPDFDGTTTYVDFKRLVLNCIAFGITGVFLIRSDPVGLIIKLLT